MIRLATADDILGIKNIYNKILNYEEQTVSYTNWQKGLYPTVDYSKSSKNVIWENLKCFKKLL